MGILDKIIKIPFEGSYIKAQHPKTQIVIHHTVSGGSAKAVASYWAGLKARIATAIIIDKAGIPYQLFSSKYYGGHIGGKSTMQKAFSRFGLPYRNCSKSSIGVELVAWGGLKMIDGKLHNCYGSEYKGDATFIKKGFRGYNYFDSYTEAQIETLKELLIFWNERYDIPLDYNYDDFFDISEKALRGDKGIYSHCSFRLDKSDLAPQSELIEMLENL